MGLMAGERTFTERHAWKLFLALGLLGIAFGVSDLLSAVTFVSRQLAVAIIVIGVLQTAICATALRGGQRWAWFVMWIWPVYAVVDLLVLTTAGPGRPEIASVVYSTAVAVVTVLALVLSRGRYRGAATGRVDRPS